MSYDPRARSSSYCRWGTGESITPYNHATSYQKSGKWQGQLSLALSLELACLLPLDQGQNYYAAQVRCPLSQVHYAVGSFPECQRWGGEHYLCACATPQQWSALPYSCLGASSFTQGHQGQLHSAAWMRLSKVVLLARDRANSPEHLIQ